MDTAESPEPDSLVDRLMALYERAPIVRLVVAAHPPLAIAEAGLLATYKWWRHRRMYVLADEMIALNLNPSDEQVRSREFSEAFGATARRVLETKREEKIRLFARLFASYVGKRDTTPEGFDAFEEQLDILDEVGYRKFQLLLVLRRYEAQFPARPDQNQAQRTHPYWNDFLTESTRTLNIAVDELEAMLQRLTRTGLYQIVTGSYMDYSGGRGYLTPLFDSLLEKLQVQGDRA